MFWQRFEDLCKANNGFPTVVARECGVKSAGSIGAWKNGSVPREPVLSNIANHFGVNKAYLLGLDEIPRDPTDQGYMLLGQMYEAFTDPFLVAMHGYAGSLTDEDKETIIKMAQTISELRKK